MGFLALKGKYSLIQIVQNGQNSNCPIFHACPGYLQVAAIKTQGAVSRTMSKYGLFRSQGQVTLNTNVLTEQLYFACCVKHDQIVITI